jgi:hypothetical protein
MVNFGYIKAISSWLLKMTSMNMFEITFPLENVFSPLFKAKKDANPGFVL